ncbi:hypothetical protein N752_13880 [Desulforamulus aquiferis]|nr:hypothetical protein N752_13880 [Desulforamulus aquiferis]
MAALFIAADIDPSTQEELALKDASTKGRLFAKAGGVATAVSSQVTNIALKVASVQGLGPCITSLKSSVKDLKEGRYLFLECMACEGGCVGGPGTLVSPAAAVRALEKHS